MPIKKLALLQDQFKNPDITFQVYLWIAGGPILCAQSLEDKIKNYLENLSEKDELVIDAYKIKAEQRYCSNVWILTLYIKAPSLCRVKVAEEEFMSFIENNT